MGISAKVKRNYSLRNFLEEFDLQFGHVYESTPASLGWWALNTPIILDGHPFSFYKHELLMTPYTDNHPHMVEIKAAQTGLTTKAMLAVSIRKPG